MTQHEELTSEMHQLVGWLEEEEWAVSSEIAKRATLALESQSREIAAMRKLHPMPANIPIRMKREICVSTGWSGSLVERSYNELRQHMMGQSYIEAQAEIAALKERVEGLRKDAERLDWLESSEVMHGFCHMGYGDFRHYAHQQAGYPSVRAVLDAAIAAKGGSQ